MQASKSVLFIFLCWICILPVFSQEANFPVPSGVSNQLFYLQRTSNTNTIVYQLNYKDGNLDTENPVQGFWIRYQEQGQRQELSYIQRKFAYGLKTRKISDDLYELNFVSYKNYKLYLKTGTDRKFYVYTNINQKSAILTHIFIKINGGSFWSPNIEYVEITGMEPTTRSIVRERLKI